MLRTRRLAAVIWSLGVLALAAGAVPAFTADTGTIAATVTVAAPPAPCIQLSTTTLDFGTAPFATNGNRSQVDSSGITFTNCSPTAVSKFAISATDPSGAGGSWSLTDPWSNCDGRLNKFGAIAAEVPERYLDAILVTTDRTLLHHRPPANNEVQTFDPGESDTFGFSIYLPCVGSTGAGQAFSFSIRLMATVA